MKFQKYYLKTNKQLTNMSKLAVTKNERSNQLAQVADYDVKRMVFSDPIKGSIPNTTISYKRINISTLNKDGSVGDLILPTERLFSFGVSENVNPETKKVNGHVLSLCLFNRDGPTTAEKAWVDTFNNIAEHCKKHLIKNKEEIEQYELAMNDLKKFNVLYYRREKGKIVEGTGPTLYAKLIASKKHNKILSMFFNTDSEPLDPLTLLGKYCYVKAAIKVESIFVGNKISFQVKLYEAEVEMMDAGMKPLLSRPKVSTKLLSSGGTNMNEMKSFDDEDFVADPVVEDAPPAEDGGSIHNSDAEDSPVKAQAAAPPVKKIIKKVAVKK
jgi:hypothetical protein